jgi:glucose-1-phosphate adenylyltransferase
LSIDPCRGTGYHAAMAEGIIKTVSTERVLGVIMGGGEGRRLFPLTKERSKPAVPIASKYRLVDIPISNCLNSGIRRMFVLTQFNSHSLHRHIHDTYHFDRFSRGFVEILAAQQTFGGASWYQGTADAVRQNLKYLVSDDYDHILILSGDQLYRMDFRKVLEQHIETNADITIATIPVKRDIAKSLGILQIGANKEIVRFVEKPKEDHILDQLRVAGPLLAQLGLAGSGDHLLASMGIYVFKRDVLTAALNNTKTDFGKHIIPDSIGQSRVFAYIFQGYWEDVGTIKSFFEANLAMSMQRPAFDLFARAPVYTHARFLPPSKIIDSYINESLIADGCVIQQCRIERCVVGVRACISPGCEFRDTIIMGCDFLGAGRNQMANPEQMGIPHISIGANCKITRAIVDKNVRIGDDVIITGKDGRPDADGPNYYIRDGIVIIPKNTDLPSGTCI